MEAPKCGRCGALVTNPQAVQCQYCGNALTDAAGGYRQAAPAPAPAPGYGAYPPAQGYGAPQPQQMMPTYGQPPPPGYGQQPYGYGGYPQPQQQQWGQPPIQQWQPPAGYYNRGSGMSAWGVITWIRIGIAVLVLFGFAFSACVSALAH